MEIKNEKAKKYVLNNDQQKKKYDTTNGSN